MSVTSFVSIHYKIQMTMKVSYRRVDLRELWLNDSSYSN